MSKKTTFALIVIIALGFIGALIVRGPAKPATTATPSTSPHKDTTTPWSTYDNDTFKYTFKYHPSYHLAFESTPKDTAIVQNFDGGATSSVPQAGARISVVIEHAPFTVAYASRLAAIKKIPNARPNDITVKVDGHDAHRIELDIPDTGHVTYYLIKNGTQTIDLISTIGATTDTNSRNDLMNDFEASQVTFKFKK